MRSCCRGAQAGHLSWPSRYHSVTHLTELQDKKFEKAQTYWKMRSTSELNPTSYPSWSFALPEQCWASPTLLKVQSMVFSFHPQHAKLHNEPLCFDCCFLTLNYTSACSNSAGLAMRRDKLYTVAHVAMQQQDKPLVPHLLQPRLIFSTKIPLALSPLPLCSMSSHPT